MQVSVGVNGDCLCVSICVYVCVYVLDHIVIAKVFAGTAVAASQRTVAHYKVNKQGAGGVPAFICTYL